MRKTAIMTVFSIACAAALAAAVPAVAAQAGNQEARTSVPYEGQFDAVAVSSGKAWAVGPAPVAQSWNGKTWAESNWGVNLRTEYSLPSWYDVAAVSARSAWAVGYFPAVDDGYSSLTARWSNGTWSRVPSPNPGGQGTALNGVAATSAGNAWAVGTAYGKATGSATGSEAIILHWNGKSWARVSIPHPGDEQLTGVTATSASNAWAVGGYQDIAAGTGGILILHWNGKSWTQVPSPAGIPAVSPEAGGITATSASNAWIVGTAFVGSAGVTSTRTVILHWNGKSWTRVPSPTPGTTGHGLGSGLSSVAATSAGNAWAVGTTDYGFGVEKTLILHWNGKSWTQVPSPNPGGAGDDQLYGVAISSADSSWAVGSAGNSVMILHWNGAHWLNFQSANELFAGPGSVAIADHAARRELVGCLVDRLHPERRWRPWWDAVPG